MAKQKKAEYVELAARIKPLMPLHIDQIAAMFNITPKTADYVVRHFINIDGQDLRSKEKPKDVKGDFWGSSSDDYYIDPAEKR